MEIAAILLAGFSLIVSVITLYLTQLKPPSISCIVGSLVHIFYNGFSNEGLFSLNFFIPVSYINTSNRAGIVFNTALTIYRKDTPEQQFFMRAETFGELQDNSWRITGVATPIFVGGKSAETKIINFSWDPQSDPKFILKEGSYTIMLFYWLNQNSTPFYSTHELYIDGATANRLEEYRNTQSIIAIQQGLDRQLGKSKLMSEHERKALLG